MTNEERAAIMQATAEFFVKEADTNYQGFSNEELTAIMFGHIAGAFAVLAASELPWKNIIDATSDVVAQMRGEPT